MSLEKSVFNFLEKNLTGDSPLLVALSGGPDSLCLTNILFNLQKELNFTFEVAHVNHNYRSESCFEEQELKKWTKEKGIIFHSTTLTLEKSANLEKEFRQKRLHFFKSLFEKKNYQSLLMAHHQNDLEETVLKRFLEGASLEKIGSLKPKANLLSMPIWRPLLTHQKQSILDYVEENNLKPFIDPTNFDGSNLRSKMRGEIIPFLEEKFGKKVRTALCSFAKVSNEFEEYLKDKIDPSLYISQSDFGMLYNFSKNELHPFEMKYLLRNSLKERGISLHKEELHKSVFWLLEKTSGKKWVKGDHTLYFYQGMLLVLPSQIQELPFEKVPLKEGEFTFGPWTVSVEKGKKEGLSHFQWRDLFEKQRVLISQVSSLECFLKKTSPLDRFENGKKIEKHYENFKAPKYLQKFFPVIEIKKNILKDFLTPKKEINTSNSVLNVFMSYKKD